MSSKNIGSTLGKVEWFNNRAGFGFVTTLEGDKKDEDIFVHHSGVVVSSEQYKYLVQVEYVSYDMKESDNSDHPFQAGNVRGVMGGKLMCETRMENKKDDSDGGSHRPRRNWNGPRDDVEGQTFVLMRKDGNRRPRRGQSSDHGERD